MSVYGDLYNALISTLQADTTLAGYVKAVYSGVRKDIPTTMYPCIIVEPTGIPEDWTRFPNKRRGKLACDIHCILTVYDNDKQMTGGETDAKGVIDFAEDTLNALDADLTLGGKCSTSIAYVKDNGFVYDYFPQREIIIAFEAEVAFTKGAR